MPLQRNRVKSSGGNITIENLRRADFGYYQCVVSNEVATIVSGTQLVIEVCIRNSFYKRKKQNKKSIFL